MKKWLSLLLLCSFLLPFVSQSAHAIDRFDYENVAKKDYEEDIYYFEETEGNNTCSSGSINRWQIISKAAGTTKQSATDPENEANKVFLLASPAAGTLSKRLFWTGSTELTDKVVYSFDFYLPSHSVGEGDALPTKNSNVSFTHAGETYADFVYDEASETYRYTLLGKTGALMADRWFHISLCFTPNADGTNRLFAQMSGEGLYNENGEAISYANTEKTVDYRSVSLSTKANYFYLCVNPAPESQAALYVDNSRLYKMYDFAPATVTPTYYAEDGFANFDLEGKITLTLHHELDLSTVDLDRVRVTDKMAQNLPFASVSLAAGEQNTLVFDFAGNKLPKYSDIFFCFDETFLDLAGESMHDPVVKFTTKGDKGEVPPPTDVVEVPAEGFVMPDEWNTGYRCAREDLVPFEEKYPEFAGAESYLITETIARKYNYEFSHFVSHKTIYVITPSPVYLHDFLQDGAAIWNGRTGGYPKSKSLTIAWMEGCNNQASVFFSQMDNATLSHCFVHDVKTDHIHGREGLTIEYCYFRDGGTRAPGAHADVIQFMGDNERVQENIRIYGNRFDIPHLLYDHVANACFFFSPEEELKYGFSNLQAVGNWLNGGGYTTYLSPEQADNTYGRVNQLYFNYNKFGYGHSAGKYLNTSYGDGSGGANLAQFGGSYIGNGYVETLEAGSVVFYNGADENANRVFSIGDLTAGEARVMVNLANYMTLARGFSIVVTVKDKDGNAVLTQTETGEVRRYIPTREYITEDNKIGTGIMNPEHNKLDQEIMQLINLPDLPRNVPQYIDIKGLPTDMTGYSISVEVYDIAAGQQTSIRTSVMGESILDYAAHKESAEVTQVQVRFEDADGNLLSLQTLPKGENATAPTPPVREGYVFLGWSGSYTNVQMSVTVKALYERRYTVTFLDKDGQLLASVSVGEGKNATAPTPPAYEGYAFVGWSESIQNIQSDLTVTPVYQKVIPPTVTAFMSAVNGISAIRKEDFTARLMALKTAESAYLLVADEDKEDENVKTAYAHLLLQVEAYNEDVDAVNHTFNQAVCGAIVTLDRGRQLSTLKFFVSLS